MVQTIIFIFALAISSIITRPLPANPESFELTADELNKLWVYFQKKLITFDFVPWYLYISVTKFSESRSWPGKLRQWSAGGSSLVVHIVPGLKLLNLNFILHHWRTQCEYMFYKLSRLLMISRFAIVKKATRFQVHQNVQNVQIREYSF